MKVLEYPWGFLRGFTKGSRISHGCSKRATWGFRGFMWSQRRFREFQGDTRCLMGVLKAS